MTLKLKQIPTQSSAATPESLSKEEALFVLPHWILVTRASHRAEGWLSSLSDAGIRVELTLILTSVFFFWRSCQFFRWGDSRPSYLRWCCAFHWCSWGGECQVLPEVHFRLFQWSPWSCFIMKARNGFCFQYWRVSEGQFEKEMFFSQIRESSLQLLLPGWAWRMWPVGWFPKLFASLSP